MSTIDTVVFDFGGVLIDWNPRYLYRNVFDDEREMEYFLSQVCSPSWNGQMDCGVSFQVAIEELVVEHPRFKEEIRFYKDRWIEMVAGPIEGTPHTLQELSDLGLSLYGLTNWSAETLPMVLRTYGFFSLFQGIAVSGVERIAKPDPSFYRVLMDRYRLSPKRSVFIDDSQENIAVAKALGFHTVHFRSDRELRSALAAIGILTVDE